MLLPYKKVLFMFHQAQLAISAFTRGKDQLEPVDVEQTRGISNVRILVERVIGLLRGKSLSNYH